MRYKICIANKEAEIEESEIEETIKKLGEGGVIILKHIIFNSAYFQAIVPDSDSSRQDAENSNLGIKKKESPSEFAKLLSPKLKMFPEENNKLN
jgi:hypothetical protein